MADKLRMFLDEKAWDIAGKNLSLERFIEMNYGFIMEGPVSYKVISRNAGVGWDMELTGFFKTIEEKFNG